MTASVLAMHQFQQKAYPTAPWAILAVAVKQIYKSLHSRGEPELQCQPDLAMLRPPMTTAGAFLTWPQQGLA